MIVRLYVRVIQAVIDVNEIEIRKEVHMIVELNIIIV